MKSPPTTAEVATIPLLAVGAILFSVGWFVGVMLLWRSPVWRLRDKLIGTLVLPGGLFGSVVGILRMPGDLAHPSPLMSVAQLALLLAPLYTAAHLGHRLRTVRRLAPAAVPA